MSTCAAGMRWGRRAGLSVCSVRSAMRAHLADRVIEDIHAGRRPGGATGGQPRRARVPFDDRNAVSRRGRPCRSAAPAARRLGGRLAGVGIRSAAHGDHPRYRGEVAARHRRPDGRHLRRLRGGRVAGPVCQAQRHHSVGARTGGPTARQRRHSCGRTLARPWHATIPAPGPRTRRRLRRALPGLARRRRRRRDDRARVHRRGHRRRADAEPSCRLRRGCGCCHGRNVPAQSGARPASRE